MYILYLCMIILYTILVAIVIAALIIQVNLLQRDVKRLTKDMAESVIIIDEMVEKHNALSEILLAALSEAEKERILHDMINNVNKNNIAQA